MIKIKKLINCNWEVNAEKGIIIDKIWYGPTSSKNYSDGYLFDQGIQSAITFVKMQGSVMYVIHWYTSGGHLNIDTNISMLG